METYDVVVLGTGAAGLTAGLAAASSGASVGLFEKSARVGGTTALSGGVVWLPDNKYARQAGISDSRDEALTYLRSLSNGTMREEMIAAFVDGVGELVDWLEEETPVRLKLVARYPDYHPERPGGKPGGGRSLEPELTSLDAIGEWAGSLAGQPRRLYIGEIPSGGGTGVIPDDVFAGRKARNLEGLGRGLVAGLLQGCLEREIVPEVGARAAGLLVESGRVAGVHIERPEGGPRTVRARNAVVLATGGFEWDADLARTFLRGPIDHPPGVSANTGDGLKMAMKIGVQLGNMREAWWVPVIAPPGAVSPGGGQLAVLLLRERTLPGTIMVNRTGRRFTNEAASYNALGPAFHAFEVSQFRYANIPAWLILDGQCVTKYGCFGTKPGGNAPGWMTRARSLTALADALGLPGSELTATVARWNDQVRRGHDGDFGRGQSIYDGWCGDQTHYGTPQATLGEISSPPFYAVRVYPSVLGTKGGPQTNPDGQVLDLNGELIAGLFAVGNVMAAPTGMAYGGAGGTLGPAMVFGYRAGRHAAMPVPAQRLSIADSTSSR